MFAKTILLLVVLLAFISVTTAQERADVVAKLKPLDFGLIRIGVANPKPGAKSASSFIEVSGGFAIKEISGCTLTLRNEGLDKGRKFIFDVVIPIGELESRGSIGEAAGEVGPTGSVMDQEFYPWSVTFDVKGYQRKIMLYDRVRKRVLARGAHVSFRVREHSFLDQFNETFSGVIKMCQHQESDLVMQRLQETNE